jgi:ATP/maltotriose-dependent transcriptional regulator MalT
MRHAIDMRSRPRARSARTRRSPAPAKLAPPRVANVVARPRLFKHLDQAARRPVIWVEGPAGSGKTTLAAGWVARRGGKSLWYQLDARDRDPATFFYYLREAVQRAAPRRREPLPLLTPEYLAGLETYARNFFDGVFERLGPGAVLVLDDFQEIPDDAALHRVLAAVLAAIPEGAHVLVLSRAAPPPALARLRANSLVATLGWDALRFTLREAAGLLAAQGIPRPRSGALAALHHEVDGWAAGLVLLGESARRGDRLEAGLGTPRAEVFGYFASEIFDRADPVAQRVLLATAPLSGVSPEIADRLAGEGAGARLERLARDNFFTTRRGDGAPVYQYHPLFRAFLRARAEVTLAPGERGAQLRRAAELVDGAGQPEEALDLLQEAGDGIAAAALVARLAPALAAQGRLQTLEAWIRALPAEVREASPWLLHWLGVCRLLADPRESLALEERAFAAFQALGEDAGSLAAWTGAMNALYFGWADPAAAEPWLRWIDARTRRTAEFPTPQIAADVSASMIYRLLWSAPSHPELPTWVARLAGIVPELEDPAARARALSPVAWYRDWIGDLAGVGAAVEALERACRAPGVAPDARIFGLGFCAMSATFAACDPERALALASEALRLARVNGIHAQDLWMNAIAATALLSRRDVPGAERYLEVLRRHAGADFVADCYGLRAASWQALLLGDPDRALEAAERALDAAERARSVFLRTLASYHLAQVHRVRGAAANAERHLAVAEETAVAGRGAPFAWACRLARAQLALDGGQRHAGRQLLAGALAEGRERGFTNVPFSSADLAFAGVCEEALEVGIEVEYVERLIRLHDLTPDPARAGAAWPFALRVTALGPFAARLADGRTLAGSAARSRPLELLRALAALGGREVPAARLVDLLWPDADGDRGRQRLRFTLHALRRLLGQEELVRFEKGLLSLDARRVWVDAWELERQLGRLAAAVERHREDEAADALGRAIALHRGPLLEGEDAPWAVAARDRLAARLRRLVVRAVELEGVDELAELPILELACEQFPREAGLQRALGRARAAAARAS